jgi:hypothetical protein
MASIPKSATPRTRQLHYGHEVDGFMVEDGSGAAFGVADHP